MRPLSTICRAFVLLLLAAGTARAVPILDVTSALLAGDPTQLGRLSRNGIPQDWANSEPFPGVINPTTVYNYHVYSVNVGITPFVQVSFDSVPANTFVSAYLDSYDPTNLATNWLGDAGFSGNLFGVDPVFFQVVVPINHDLMVVVNTTALAGLGQEYRLLAEGFIDTEYTEPVPEPDTLLLSGGGLVLLAVGRFLRQGA